MVSITELWISIIFNCGSEMWICIILNNHVYPLTFDIFCAYIRISIIKGFIRFCIISMSVVTILGLFVSL